ncbi:MAG: dimethyl sulfoxide reductase anchor subunit [Xanthomonadales bacterium]|nr:dimethyl sulfoxide reductase anchor subunit [Gammaproteobacteria bacterium]MBT8054624.1 dimethyl sulfoxide reductase anchor subunit [Gammaproteobacteria bacterium]NND58126.1 dimethyl sulfoxide reductase anchor subunit [Xanthomonadales bacterium]NNK50399.1 dimethyl sulfoxide reductase anchor subunit [Xanthomonadales bacterium]
MDPAYSVILFTSASGAGYGLIAWLAFTRLSGFWQLSPLAAGITCLVALALITTGLLSSTFHLGHPERAWRAMSQWRSSWLSREGIFAILTYPAALIFTAGWFWSIIPASIMNAAAAATLLLSVITVISTGMIYASLTTIPRWNNAWVVPVYVALAIASGGLLFSIALAVSGAANQPTMVLMMAVLLVSWAVKWAYWRYIDRQSPASTTATATGLGHLGQVSQLEAPHTSENYLLKEMGFEVARKHATKLRRMALNFGLLLPGILLVLAGVSNGLVQLALLALALCFGLGGVVIERWLFFAEARHAVTLFYGRSL